MPEDDKVASLEIEIKIMANTQKQMSLTLEKMAKSLDSMNSFYTDLKLVQEKQQSLDRELSESFKRVHVRQDKTDATFTKLAWLVITPIVLALIGTYMKGGI